MRFDINFLRGGRAIDAVISYAGFNSRYWSFTVNSIAGAYNFYFNNINIYPSYTNTRAHGIFLHCLAR